MEKETWIAPEIIVLVRSEPEEAVLATCKGFTIAGTVLADYTHCLYPGCGAECTDYRPS